MSRDLFGPWGRELTAQRFSAALAGLAAFGPLDRLPPSEGMEKKAQENLERSGAIVEALLTHIACGIGLIKAGNKLISASDYALLWEGFSNRVAPTADICIELNSQGGGALAALAPDILWLLRELGRPGGAAGAAYLRSQQRELPVSFELPLRFGVLDDPDSAQIARLMDANRWRHLFRIVRPEAPALQCDMLILPFDLQNAASRLPAESLKIETDCVIVMRGVGELDSRQVLSRVSSLLARVQTSGLAIARVPAESDGAWLDSLVFHLAHDTPLVSALPRVQQDAVPAAAGGDAVEGLPIVIASRRLARVARVREFSGRLERAARAVATAAAATPLMLGASDTPAMSIEAEADNIAKYVKEGKWLSELHEATEVVTARRRIEGMVGGEVRVPRMGEPTAGGVPRAKPPKQRRLPDRRRVLIDLYDVTDRKSRRRVEDRLMADGRYEVELFIAVARPGSVVASGGFPFEKLPPGAAHILSIHFVPLVRAGSGEMLPGQHKKLRLPERDDSKACTFRFDVPMSVLTYRARFIISYRNRVLQTLILSAPVGDRAGEFHLDVENVVEPSFEKLAERRRFDVALVVNDSPSGVPGVITLRGDEAVFAEPAGLEQMTEDLRKFILEKSAFPAPKRKYESKDIRDLIYSLSRKGKNLWDELPPAAQELLKDVTTRIQIVDARSGAYFPAEFVCRGRSPEKDAKLCPNGAKALQAPAGSRSAGPMSHEKCEHREDPHFICPLRMWGFSIVIERQPAMGVPRPGFILRDVTGKAGRGRTDVFERVVVSVSKKVTDADKNGAESLVAALGKVAKKVSFARNWSELKGVVARESPTLLILLPHSDVDEEDPTIPALELGGVMLSRDRLEREYLLGPESAQPILLLLGCDTDRAEIPFLNFIKRFKDCGAAMVMGTITQIDGLRTVDFVKRFVDAAASANRRSSTFGELLLETRRKMLATGDSYALSLLAYGDTDQRA